MPASSHVELTAFRQYAKARRAFLSTINADDSCRDPLSEFAEWVVLQELGGRLADSRVQKGYDLISSDGQKVQVKYLANPGPEWRNEHYVQFTNEMDQYAIVFFEGLELITMIVFPRDSLGDVYRLLKKRHSHQETTLQLTNRNYKSIVNDRTLFEPLGVLCFAYGQEC